MLCITCHGPGGPICASCSGSLRRAPERILPGGVRLVAAFSHTGAAVVLVHELKYRGLLWYADVVAEILAPQLPEAPIVPVPRVWSRYLRYGVDPAMEIGMRLSARLGYPVIDLFQRPLHAPRRAGGDHNRPPPRPRLRAGIPPVLTLVDDVVTTGATLAAAVSTVGAKRVVAAVSANTADGASTLLVPSDPFQPPPHLSLA